MTGGSDFRNSGFLGESCDFEHSKPLSWKELKF